jgi:hypothetical protein
MTVGRKAGDTPERVLRRRQAAAGRQRSERDSRPRGEVAEGSASRIRSWRAADASGDPGQAGTDRPRRNQPGEQARARAERLFSGDDGGE